MSDELKDDVVDYLRAPVDRVHLRLGRIETDIGNVKLRLTLVERQIGQLSAAEQSHHAISMQRIDGVEARLGRIERRLDLVDAP